jgi:hypothetical protein
VRKEASLSPEVLKALLAAEMVRADRLHEKYLDTLEENLQLREKVLQLQARLAAAGVPCDLSSEDDARQMTLGLR